jgi:hypothetical protein
MDPGTPETPAPEPELNPGDVPAEPETHLVSEAQPAPVATVAAVADNVDGDGDGAILHGKLRPFLGKWFENKSHGDVSSLSTFLAACGWSWATRPLLCNAPNQMWVVEQHADDSPEQMRIGVELNALMQRLVHVVGAAPFVRYDCSGAEFEFELFTGVTGHGKVSWEGEALHMDKFIVAPSYVLECHWVYSIVAPAPQPVSLAMPQVARATGSVEEAIPPTTATTSEEAIPVAAEEDTSAGGVVDIPYSDREEMWCRQSNRVFKRAAAAIQGTNDGTVEGTRTLSPADLASLKGDAVPAMDHEMHQVWGRARDGDGGVLGALMR